MSPATREITLAMLATSSTGEQFDAAIQRALRNIRDDKTEATFKRTVTLTLELAPDESREDIEAAVKVDAKIAPERARKSKVYMGEKADGTLVASMYDPRQPGLFDEGDPDVHPLRRKNSEAVNDA